MKSIPFRLKIIDKCQLTNKLVQMNEFQKNAFTRLIPHFVSCKILHFNLPIQFNRIYSSLYQFDFILTFCCCCCCCSYYCLFGLHLKTMAFTFKKKCCNHIAKKDERMVLIDKDLFHLKINVKKVSEWNQFHII